MKRDSDQGELEKAVSGIALTVKLTIRHHEEIESAEISAIFGRGSGRNHELAAHCSGNHGFWSDACFFPDGNVDSAARS